MIVSIRGNKRRLFLIGSQSDLMITLKSVQKAHPRVSISGIYQLINLRHGKQILWTCLVQVSEVNTNLPFAILFFYQHGIRKPLRKEYLFYSLGFLQFLNLLPDSLNVLLS